jgi:hypothetical protein
MWGRGVGKLKAGDRVLTLGPPLGLEDTHDRAYYVRECGTVNYVPKDGQVVTLRLDKEAGQGLFALDKKAGQGLFAWWPPARLQKLTGLDEMLMLL